MSSKNQYEKKAAKNSLLGAITETQETKGDVKGSLIETGKDLVVGVIVGGVVGAALGRASLLVGAGITGVGHYTNNRLVSILGFGMMASNGFQPKTEGVSGSGEVGALEGVKERVMAFKDSFSQKLFLDKILKKKSGEAGATDKPVSGLGEAEYFTYPQIGEVDMTALDQIERQVEQSAEAFKARQDQMKGILPSDESMGDSLDPTERNF